MLIRSRKFFLNRRFLTLCNIADVRTLEKGKFEIVRLGGMTIGRGTYEPGWKWSMHVGPALGATRCNVEHAGMVRLATAAMEDGAIHELRAGTVFYIPPGPPGHDSWVSGESSARGS